jgi:hypothetical protein
MKWNMDHWVIDWTGRDGNIKERSIPKYVQSVRDMKSWVKENYPVVSQGPGIRYVLSSANEYGEGSNEWYYTSWDGRWERA